MAMFGVVPREERSAEGDRGGDVVEAAREAGVVLQGRTGPRRRGCRRMRAVSAERRRDRLLSVEHPRTHTPGVNAPWRCHPCTRGRSAPICPHRQLDFQTPALAMDHPALSARFTDILASRGGRRGFPCSLFHACRRQYGGADRFARFPAGGSLRGRVPHRPRGRSTFTRVAPAWSLSRPGRPVAPECFSRSRYLLQPLRLLPAGATVAGRDSHPQGDDAFPRRTE